MNKPHKIQRGQIFGVIGLVAFSLGWPIAAAEAELSDPIHFFRRGRPQGPIVVADQPRGAALDAAAALQEHLAAMTGKVVPILTTSEYDGQSVAFLVGQSRLTVAMGIKINQTFDAGDQYAIKSRGRFVALVGNDDLGRRGSAYAVYELLDSLGCGWFGPDPVWHVVPKTREVNVVPLNVERKPAFDMRHIWMATSFAGQETLDYWRLTARLYTDSHTVRQFLPRDEYVERHPEYFSNTDRDKWQPCFSNPEVVSIYAQKIRRIIDASKRGVVGISISQADTDEFCKQDMDKIGNPSAVMLHFANALAKDLRRTHAGRFRLKFLAYWVTHQLPKPMMRAEPEVIVSFVNEGNHVQPWTAPEPAHLAQRARSNSRELHDFTGWLKTGATVGIREWWIPGTNNNFWRVIPWYSGQTTIDNLHYWHRHQVTQINYETRDYSLWPKAWPQYYIAARAMWTPDLTSEQIMTEACAKLFCKAAVPMFRFYRTIETAMRSQKKYGGKNWHLPSPHLIYTSQNIQQANSNLRAASEATDNPAVLSRIDQERAMWERARQAIVEAREQADKS